MKSLMGFFGGEAEERKRGKEEGEGFHGWIRLEGVGRNWNRLVNRLVLTNEPT